MRGRLFVIDGPDGTGKQTQVALLVEHLRAEGHTVGTLDFPRYGEPSAWFAESYIDGKFGTFTDVPPKVASLFYALDRYAHRAMIADPLADGAMIVLDRYVSANVGHQAAKLATRAERESYVRWNEELEYEILGVPRPDLQIVLHLSHDLARTAMERQGRLIDLLEADTTHQERSARAFLEAAERPGWTVVECSSPDGTRFSPEDIHAEIWSRILPLLSA